jgi:ABC-type lipoprotein release transport system permease subunit
MLLTLAFRNLWRNRRRTLLTLSAMVVSAALLILALGVFSGMFKDMLASATEQYHGHLVLAQPEYHLRRDLFAHLPAEAADLPALREGTEIENRNGRRAGFCHPGRRRLNRQRPADCQWYLRNWRQPA